MNTFGKKILLAFYNCFLKIEFVIKKISKFNNFDLIQSFYSMQSIFFSMQYFLPIQCNLFIDLTL